MLQPQFNLCRACQAENRLTANFCRKCGYTLIDDRKLSGLNRKVRDQLPDLFYADLAAAGESAVADAEAVVAVEAVAEAIPEIITSVVAGNHVVDLKVYDAACLGCSVRVRVADSFCLWCGHKQANKQVQGAKNCAGCKTQLPSVANFCFSCGFDVALGKLKTVRVPAEMFAEEESELFPRFEA